MSIAQVGPPQFGQGTVLALGPAFSPLPPAAPASAPYGSGQPSPNQPAQRHSYVSYTTALTATLLASLVMSLLTAFVTYGIMSRRKPAKAMAPPAEPSHQMEQIQQREPEAKRTIDQVTARNVVDGIATSIIVPIWPTVMEGQEGFPNPLSMDGLRLHPRQQHSDCALHALQMLLGGDPALLSSITDLQIAKRHLHPAQARSFDKSTIVQPSEFAEIYQKLIEIKLTEAKRALDNLNQRKGKLSLKELQEYGDLADPIELSRRLDLIDNVQKRAGKLDEQTFKLDRNDASLDARLRAALGTLVGPRIILAKPHIEGRFGDLQEMLGFKHHYVELAYEDGLWVKRDPEKEKVQKLKHPDGKPVIDPYDAIKAELTWEKSRPKGESSTDLDKPTHVFIPTAR